MQKEMIYIGSDHAGFEAKKKIKEYLNERKINYDDIGPSEYKEGDDYPDYAFKVAIQVAKNKGSKGILVCGSGAGMVIAANKVKGIRAVEAYDKYTARKSREHNDANVLALGARNSKFSSIKNIVDVWINCDFKDVERHRRRLKEISRYENQKNDAHEKRSFFGCSRNNRRPKGRGFRQVP